VIVELTGLKNMKHITTTLMLIAGFQFSINAETLFFESFYEKKTLSNLPTKDNLSEILDLHYYNDALNLAKMLGTIRLEVGEKLTLGKIKFLKENLDLSGYVVNRHKYPSFELELKYDFFSKTKTLKIQNTSTKEWGHSISDDIYSGNYAEWPIEGPVTITIKCNPMITIIRRTDVNDQHYRLDDLSEQYIGISFEKSISSINNNQSKQQVLVLPKGSKNMNVIMESSEDLVNWTTDTLGLKTTADGHRFFRLRAVKE